MRLNSGLGVVFAAALMTAAALVASGTGSAEEIFGSSAGGGGTPAVGTVFAPDTDPAYAASVLQELRSGPAAQRFGNHWTPASTALNNGGAGQGDALELTWSIIPDGTPMPGFAGEATCNSNLIATFDGIYGAGFWQAEIQAVWDDWTGLSGNRYTPAVALDAAGTPIDDGAPWPSSAGVAGVRGDIRIGGCSIDGDSGVLAYNFFPSTGDMKIDATDSFFPRSSLTTGFHNVFSHEHGHGAGLFHVCPRDGTKLMEPIVNLGFTGLQHDDIRGVQRGYGDRFELINNPNDSRAAATALTPSPTQTEAQLSLDSTTDRDWFAFTASVGETVDVTVDPNGFTYNEAADPGGGCGGGGVPGSPLNSESLQDLSFEIRDSDGVLTTVNGTGAGVAESISDFALLATGTYYVRVSGTGTDDAQLYDLTLTKNPRVLGPPSAPTGVTGTPGDAQVAVSWTAPASTGGSPITGYTTTASPGGRACSTTGAATCTVTGLTNGTPYTFTTTATNTIGNSVPSTPSPTVTPTVPPMGIPVMVTVEPGRFLDTRPNGFTIDNTFLGTGKLTAGTITTIKITGRNDIPTNAVGVEVNLTAIQSEERGFATLYPCTRTPPTASSLNYTPGVNIANATTVALNTRGEVCIFTSSTAHYALDVLAYIPTL